MTLSKRLSLVALGIIIFLIATPMLVLFARGFLFDYKHFKIIKTGTLVIKAEPPKAEIFIDDKKQKKVTPAIIRFLIPSDYNISIGKTGYQSWTKRLTVHPQLVTWVNQNRDFITLFYSTPKKINTISTTVTQVNKQKNKLAFSDNITLSELDLNNNQITNFGPANQAVSPLDFKTPLIWENYHKIFPALPYLQFNLFAKHLPDIKTVETNGDYTVFLINNQLFSNKGTDEFTLIAKNVQGFTLDSENIWYVQDTLLKRLNLNTANSEIISANIPLTDNVKVIRGGTNIFLIINHTLYTANNFLEKTYDNVQDAFWNVKTNQLLISNDYEILIYSPAEQNAELILRSSSPLKDPLLNPITGYVFFSSENTIKTIEIDGRDHRNIFSLTSILPDQNFLVSEDGKLLYIYDKNKIEIMEIR